MLTQKQEFDAAVNRHTGGLEKNDAYLDNFLFVNRHTGGLESLPGVG